MQLQLSPDLATKLPYTTALVQQAQAYTLRAQAPGHGGLGYTDEYKQLLPHASFLDVSVMPGLAEALSASEEFYADWLGVEWVRYFTTGATGAAIAAAMALFNTVAGGLVAIQSSCHMSVWDAARYAAARIVTLPPRMSPLGFALAVHPDDLREFLAAHPDLRGLILSTPSYEGAVGHLKELIEIAHAHGVVVMVDCAWGPELGRSPLLPGGPIEAGADVVVFSQHKTTASPGQVATVILPRNSRISTLQAERAARASGTTSKNSMLLAGQETGLRDLMETGERRIARAIERVEEQEARFRTMGLGHLLVDWGTYADVAGHVPYRVVFDTRETGYTGFELAAMLGSHGVQVAQPNHGFMVFGFGLGAIDHIEPIFRAVADLVGGLDPRPALGYPPLPPLRVHEIDLRVLLHRPVEAVPYRDAVGRLVADAVSPYPPGFPAVVPGQVVLPEDARYLELIFDEWRAVRHGLPDDVPAGHLLVLKE